jgi:predicted GIY-YIG superfamily endonuclease
MSHAPNSGKSKEAMVLENIVKRLQEEKKFNYLQSEPSGTELINESQNL